VAAVCVLDWLRPVAQRTHLGRFVQTVLDGGAATVVQRKAVQNWDLLTSSPLTLLVPVVTVLVGWALARPHRWRLPGLALARDRIAVLPTGLLALGVLVAIGFAANDSGVSIPPAAGAIALPLLMAVCLRVLVDAERDEVESQVAATLKATRRPVRTARGRRPKAAPGRPDPSRTTGPGQDGRADAAPE
jgi:hypothetical protein